MPDLSHLSDTEIAAALDHRDVGAHVTPPAVREAVADAETVLEVARELRMHRAPTVLVLRRLDIRDEFVQVHTPEFQRQAREEQEQRGDG